jgi:hypothetical protein
LIDIVDASVKTEYSPMIAHTIKIKLGVQQDVTLMYVGRINLKHTEISPAFSPVALWVVTMPVALDLIENRVVQIFHHNNTGAFLI